jgi:hypothetical protein
MAEIKVATDPRAAKGAETDIQQDIMVAGNDERERRKPNI